MSPCFFSLFCSVLIVLTLFPLLRPRVCSGVAGKKYDCAWGTLLDELSSYLGGIFRKFGAWLDAKGTPADAGFDDCWSDWCRLENAGYEEAEDEQEAYEAEEYPALGEIRDADSWRKRNLLETEYALLQRWLQDEGSQHMYDRFLEHLVTMREAGAYPGPSVRSLSRW